MISRPVYLLLLASAALPGCAVVSVAGTVVATTASVAGTVVSTTASVVGAGVKKAVGSDDSADKKS